VKQCIDELTRANQQLTLEIRERKRAQGSLHDAYAEVRRAKDRLQAENTYLRQELDQEYNFGELVGQGSAIALVRQRIMEVAQLNSAVLLLGEAGTGKGVVARAIHSGTPRWDRPMISVNLAALPANLVESELFGWERGECTGAEARQVGRFELADTGTIFLEEIGELPFELQERVLCVIRNGEFERLGSPRTTKLDVRVIAASSRDLEQEVATGRFREELYRLLVACPITVPPLCQRSEDIPLLVEHFLAKYHGKIGTKVPRVSRSTLDALKSYSWPGNVRELESVIERALITSSGSELVVWDRPDIPGADGEQEGTAAQVTALADLEQAHIIRVLKKTGWRIEGEHGAAGLLGLNPSTLRARMRKYGILRRYRDAS
jgi:transcriptional regulator with GAF, ATPase, and Fis domain